jgi:gliding motility-associated-like protein
MEKCIYQNALSTLFVVCISLSSFAKGNTKHPATGERQINTKKVGLDFIENKGQWASEARFKAEVPDGALFVTDKGFVYNYASHEDMAQFDEHHAHDPAHNGKIGTDGIVHMHAYKVNFQGANAGIKYVTEEKQQTYFNYFIGKDKSKWAGNVGLFRKITQQEVYNGVDVKIYSKGVSMKYDFIVKPNADASQIKLSFQDVSPVLRPDGSLFIKSSVNEVTELAPYTYQMIDGKERAVKSNYKLANGVVSFEFPEGYDKTQALVIDPVLVFATYSGGTGNGNGYYAYSTTYDDLGNMYASSGAYHFGWPTTGGAYQSQFNGTPNSGASREVGINKYNSTGSTLIYSTYYGGAGNEFPHALKVNNAGELVLTGSTNSADLPVTTGCYDNSLGGSSDMFVAHFNATGTNLIGATYVGGSNTEPTAFSFNGTNSITDNNAGYSSPMELTFDNTGNIWLVGNTNSNDIIIEANNSQNTYTINKWICHGSSYVFGTQLVNTSGNYAQTFPTASGCDSVVKLHLTVGDLITKAATGSLCPGGSYAFGNQNLTTPGTYTHTFVSALGCDSVVTLTLTSKPYITHNASKVLCPGTSYNFGGVVLTTAGTYIDTFSTLGCDSIVTLTLSVNPYITHTENETVCSGKGYLFAGILLTAPGVYKDTFSTAGCDSIVTLNLTAGTQSTYTHYRTICQGSSYAFGTQTLTLSGTYTNTFTTSGCDSVVTLNLSVRANTHDTIPLAICQGTSYIFGPDTLLTAGTFTHMFTTANGCDSMVTLQLSFNPYIATFIVDSMCYGGTYTFGTQSLTTAGTYLNFYPTSGCDSVVTLTLSIIPRDTVTFTENYCGGSNYYFGNAVLTAPGLYYHTFTSATGCDSVVRLILTGPWVNSDILSGGIDAVIFKLDPTCANMLYSAYLGGTGDDSPTGMVFNNQGNLIISGITTSNNFPTTSGTIHPTSQGSTDGFISIINPNYGTMVRSTYVGTNSIDQAVAVQVDDDDNVYVLGRTTGNYPITPGVWSGDVNGDVFIDKLDPVLSASLQSTRVGNPQNQGRYFPSSFLVDICRNVYVAGYYAAAGMPLSTNAQQTAAAPFWFGVLQPNFTGLLYGSYFGVANDHGHCGVSRMDPNGIVYQSICCRSGTYPGTTPASYAPAKAPGIGQDIVSFKFNFEATGVHSDFELAPNQNDTGCAPYTVQMVNTSNAATSYKWDFGDGTPIVTTVAPSHTYVDSGTFIITLYAHNPNTCITDDTATMTITVLKTAMPDIVLNDTVLCTFEQSIDLTVTINNPTSHNVIAWGPPAGILSAANLATVTVDPSLNDVYYVTVKDTIPGICGFSVTDTVHIDLAPRVLDILNNDTVVCQGAKIQITGSGTPAYEYRWTPATGVSDTTILDPIITVNEPNLYTITGHYYACPDTTVTLSIGMHYIPHIEMTENIAVCQGTQVALESTVSPYRNDYIYAWTPATPNLSSSTEANLNFIADTSITYYLHVQTPIGCSDRDSVRVTVYPGGFGGIVSDTGYCPGLGNKANLWATGGAQYAWTPSYGLSDTSIATPFANPETSTQYTVYITDIHNCVDTEQVSVHVYPAAILELPDSINIYPGEKYHLEPGTNATYFKWFPPSGISDINISDPILYPEVRTRYFVTATTVNGCIIIDSLDVLVKETVIDMPNAFAPSGVNSLFKPSKRGIASLKEFAIYNRWGNKVYSSSNIDAGWDGTYNGQPQPVGVYVYSIEAVTDRGTPFVKKGNVTLIR